METQSMRRLHIIDFLKGYAIFTIIVFHYLQTLKLPRPFNQLIFFGGTGVHLFILLSGFGLYLSYLNRPLPYGAFLKKRTGKIYIPYILVILISAFISLFIPVYDNSLYALGGHVFLYKMFDESIMGSYGYPLWFISTILQFYVVFHLLVQGAQRLTNIQFLLICLGVSLAWTFLVLSIGKESERVWNSFFLRYLWEFALGMIVASQLRKNHYQLPFVIKPVYILLIGIGNCALYAVLALEGGAIGKMINDVPALIGYSCIAVWVYQLGIGGLTRFFTFTGSISYSLYLLHFLILLMSLLLLKNLPLPLTLLVSLAATYSAAVYFEKAVTALALGQKRLQAEEGGVVRKGDQPVFNAPPTDWRQPGGSSGP